MQGGNLSNVVVPRVLVVFEGLIGYLSAANVDDFNKLGSRGAWPAAVALWDFDPLALAKLTDLIVRRDIKVEVVSFVMPVEGAEALAERFDQESVLVSRVIASTPYRTARRLPYGVDIARVYTPDAREALLFGGKGYHTTSVHQIGR